MLFLLASAVVASLLLVAGWLTIRWVRTSEVRSASRPNVLFWLVGAAVALVGLAVIAQGVRAVSELDSGPQGFTREGALETGDAVSTVTWGVVILVNGVYIWRGARRRGARDRLGRLLILGGYLLLGVALSGAVHEGTMPLSASEVQTDDNSTNSAMLPYLAWGVPAAFLVWVGVKLAHERILMTARLET
ncbi:membrane hypothetical protein [metagenome]|uniref:Uncharacterized protein n=1 Tax=metagenome TaxID=256318 RepID=A0A2P2C513_9ZZZZ